MPRFFGSLINDPNASQAKRPATTPGNLGGLGPAVAAACDLGGWDAFAFDSTQAGQDGSDTEPEEEGIEEQHPTTSSGSRSGSCSRSSSRLRPPSLPPSDDDSDDEPPQRRAMLPSISEPISEPHVGVRVDTRHFPGYGDEYPFAEIVEIKGGKCELFYPHAEASENNNQLQTSEVRKLVLYPTASSYTHVKYHPTLGWQVRGADGHVFQMVSPVLQDDVHDWLLTRCENKPNTFLAINTRFEKLKLDTDSTWEGKYGPVVEKKLPRACVDALFTSKLIGEAEDNVGVEQTVQPGDARIRSPSVSTSGNPPLSDTSLIGGPRVEYPQGEAATCVFMAAVNALNEYGFTMAAAKLEGLALKSLEQSDIMEYLHRTIREHFKGFHASGIPGSYDPLTDDSPHPVVFTPRGSDHSSTHAVCKLGNWLFDSSREYALPFGTDAEKQHSLDLCVRTDDSDDITYEGIVQIEGRLPGMRIIPSGTMLGKRARSH